MRRRVALALVVSAALIVAAWLVTRTSEGAATAGTPSDASDDLHAPIDARSHPDARATTRPDGGVAHVSGASATGHADEPGRPPPDAPSPGSLPGESGARSPEAQAPQERASSSAPRRLPDGGLTRGRLDAAQIREVVRAAIPELRFCFEWQLSRHPDLAGRVTLELRIAEDGSVEQAEIGEEDLGDETVLRCFRSVTGRMQFPPPENGPVTVRYPITLSPEPDPGAPTPTVEP